MSEPFETFAIIELFGHSRIAGKVSEQVIAGQGMLRVDVPALPATAHYPEHPAFTKLYGPGAIYAITPVSEEIAFAAAQSMRVEPVNVYIAVPQLEAATRHEEWCGVPDLEYDDDEEWIDVED